MQQHDDIQPDRLLKAQIQLRQECPSLNLILA
jgi:hypothetical protein